MDSFSVQIPSGSVARFLNLPRLDHQADPLSSLALPPGSRQHPDQSIEGVLQRLSAPASGSKEFPLTEEQLSGIMHDFNNLLGMVLSHTQLSLVKIPADTPGRHYLETVTRGARRAAELSAHLVALMKGRKIELALLKLNSIIEEVVDLLLPKWENRIVIRQSLARDLDLIWGNDVQFRQITMNLVINAIDAIGQTAGLITVETRNLRIPEVRYPDRETLLAGDYICLQVSDSGIGMNQETLNHIFDPYFTTKLTGTGIGLHSTLAIVHAHHGAMQVFSTPGRGSTFQVFLPTDSFAELF